MNIVIKKNNCIFKTYKHHLTISMNTHTNTYKDPSILTTVSYMYIYIRTLINRLYKFFFSDKTVLKVRDWLQKINQN